MSRPTKRAMAAFAVVGVLALAAVACGGSDGGGGSDGVGGTATTSKGDTDASAWPVTIDHRFGSTTVEARPKRIVVIDNQWLDVLLALKAPVIAAALDPNLSGTRYPWQHVPDSVASIEVTDSIPYESIAAARPDLIVVTWAAPDRDDFDKLSAIAPTIPSLGDEEVEPWGELARVAGRVLGEARAAAALVAGAEREISDVADDLPGLEGKTYALANYVPGDAIYVVADPDDGAAQLFEGLGMEIDPDLLRIADGASGRAKLSLERVDELDADVLLLLTNGADPDDIPGYADLPAVRSGAVAVLDLAAVSGLNTPSPLSIPYSLARIHKALQAAAT